MSCDVFVDVTGKVDKPHKLTDVYSFKKSIKALSSPLSTRNAGDNLEYAIRFTCDGENCLIKQLENQGAANIKGNCLKGN